MALSDDVSIYKNLMTKVETYPTKKPLLVVSKDYTFFFTCDKSTDYFNNEYFQMARSNMKHLDDSDLGTYLSNCSARSLKTIYEFLTTKRVTKTNESLICNVELLAAANTFRIKEVMYKVLIESVEAIERDKINNAITVTNFMLFVVQYSTDSKRFIKSWVKMLSRHFYNYSFKNNFETVTISAEENVEQLKELKNFLDQVNKHSKNKSSVYLQCLNCMISHVQWIINTNKSILLLLELLNDAHVFQINFHDDEFVECGHATLSVKRPYNELLQEIPVIFNRHLAKKFKQCFKIEANINDKWLLHLPAHEKHLRHYFKFELAGKFYKVGKNSANKMQIEIYNLFDNCSPSVIRLPKPFCDDLGISLRYISHKTTNYEPFMSVLSGDETTFIYFDHLNPINNEVHINRNSGYIFGYNLKSNKSKTNCSDVEEVRTLYYDSIEGIQYKYIIYENKTDKSEIENSNSFIQSLCFPYTFISPLLIQKISTNSV